MDVEEGRLEEELVDKPGTTIGTKFSVLHCVRIPFLMRCVRTQRVSPFYIVVLVFIWFWIFGWLGQQWVSPFYSFNM